MRRSSGLMVCVALAVCFGFISWPQSGYVGSREEFVGEGVRIVVSGAGGPLYISASDPTWVSHGWRSAGRYPHIVPDMLGSTGYVVAPGGLYFELQIDGVPIHLNHEVLVYHLDEPGHWGYVLTWYVQFPPNFFKPGSYLIRGEWGSRNPQTALGDQGPYIRYRELVVLP